MKKVIVLCGVVGLLALASCKTTNPYQDFAAGYEEAAAARGRPKSKWTKEETLTYLQALKEFHAEKMGELHARQSAANSYRPPVYVPIPASAPMPPYVPRTYRLVPDGRGGWTAWGQ